MSAIGFDCGQNAEVRRRNLYHGDLDVFSPTAAALGLIGHARSTFEEAYGPDSTRAQYSMTAEQFSAIGEPLKPTLGGVQ
jgi:hypothetical protein